MGEDHGDHRKESGVHSRRNGAAAKWAQTVAVGGPAGGRCRRHALSPWALGAAGCTLACPASPTRCRQWPSCHLPHVYRCPAGGGKVRPDLRCAQVGGYLPDRLGVVGFTPLRCQAFQENIPLHFLRTLKFTAPVLVLSQTSGFQTLCLLCVLCIEKAPPAHTPSYTRRVTGCLVSPGILKWVKLIDNFEGEYDYVTNEGPVFTFKTNRHSPNYRLINIDFTDPEEAKWKVLVPEHEKDVLGKAPCCCTQFWVVTPANWCISHALVAGPLASNSGELSIKMGNQAFTI